MSTGLRADVEEGVARALAEASAEARPVRPTGGGTKLGWAVAGDVAAPLPVELDEVREHNAGDLTAVVGAGVRLAELQELVGREGQMLALNLKPESAAELARRKAEHLLATDADAVVAANPGCALQIRAYARELGHELPVLHPMELLARSLGVGPA